MNLGEIQQVGTPEEVYRHPANRFVAEFVGRVNLIEGTVAGGTNGHVELAVADALRLTVPASGVSGDVTVAVRPEAVSFADGAGVNTWDADMHTVAFLGDHYEYELTAGPLSLTVVSPRKVEGDRQRIHIPPDACSVVA
jgi:ABC-type Fe3+/spermidine/putrescine transport system ATPase subunit